MRTFQKSLVLVLAVLVGVGPLVSVWAQGNPGAGEPVTAEQVREAIDGGVKYLLSEQNKNRGTWNDVASYPGGVTSLATLALLSAGVEPNHPQIQKSLEFLRKIEPTKTYSVSLQTMVFALAEPRRDQMLIQRNVDWLESIQLPDGQWSYPSASGDNSNSQFAILALHEAERAGARVKPETWRKAAKYWADAQNPDGSWGYQPGWADGLGSMTSAGIAALVICNERVRAADAEVKNGLAQCCQPHDEDDAIERALRWLGRNFSVRRNPGRRGLGHVWHYYYLYGLERVGRLTARRLIGEHDWYREGAEFLIEQQDAFSKNWVGSGHSEDNPHIASSMALLFLAKGRRPVLMSKVEHSSTEDWNNHENDMANLTARMERLWGLEMTWQILDPRSATVDDMLQSPVLFLSGSKAPELEGLESKFRDYLDRGGFVFAEACCVDGRGFVKGFREFMERVFPEEEYRLRRIGPEHPIWRVEELVSSDSPYAGRLWSIEYGCRTSVVFSEIDLSCYWELTGQTGQPQRFPDMVQSRLDDANAIGANVLAYATNREPKGKEMGFVSAIDPIALGGLGSRGTIQIAKLQHGGGCNDAPGALVNLLRSAAQGDLKLQVSVEEFPVRIDDENLSYFHFSFMHGRHDFRLNDSERENLREYLEHGGTLLADSICASKEFADAFQREMAAVLPDAQLRRIPVSDPLFSEAVGGYDLRQVSRRDPVERRANEPMGTRVREVEPELLGIEIDGRWAVIFSPYDISCALEQHESLECRGYTREDAARIGLNVLMYSLNPDVELSGERQTRSREERRNIAARTR